MKRGRHPSEKTAFTNKLPHNAAKGEIPIAKNVTVVDERGNTYEATYPKRAKGLVKNGRARFMDENTICLACPPKEDLEDSKMAEINPIKASAGPADGPGASAAQPQDAVRYTLDYVLAQIERIAVQTAHLDRVMEELQALQSVGVGDIAGQAKGEALAEVVRSREATNQQLLRLYEQMFNDLRPGSETLRRQAIALVDRSINNATLSLEEKALVSDALDTIRHLD